MTSKTASKKTPLTGYQKRLFIFLSVATFFEGYDFMALTQILPALSEEFGLRESDHGNLVAFINVGTVLAYLLIRKADRWGRRRVLTITIAGYTVFTFLSGLAPSIIFFGCAQLVARIFLIGEWVTSMVIAAEEFPASRRGMVIGVIQAFSSLGSVACAGTVPLLLNATDYGWRLIYFIGIIPLVILAYARRGLRESQRFEELKQAQGQGAETQSLFAIFKTPHRKRVLQLALIWFMTYVCTTNSVTFWKVFAKDDRGFTEGEVGLAISVAAVAAMPLVFVSGHLLDRIGRRRGALVIFGLGALGVYLSYTLHGQWPLTAGLVLGIFGVSGVLPVLNAYSTELFPTEMRSAAFAWSNNLLGRLSYVLSPIIIGHVAEATGGYGLVMRLSSVFPLIAVALIFLLLPETKERELEDTASL